jgi:hypothetical protein
LKQPRKLKLIEKILVSGAGLNAKDYAFVEEDKEAIKKFREIKAVFKETTKRIKK